jgi:hypothetical protein
VAKKKKRTARRPRKTLKRRLKRKPKSKVTEEVVVSFDPTPYQIAAVRAASGEVNPLSEVGSQSASAPMAGKRRLVANPIVSPAPVLIKPTIYPDKSDGSIIVVHNYVTVNIGSVEFKNFNTSIGMLVGHLELGRSNEISGELSAQVLSAIKAGRELLKGPKPNRDLIQLLLIKPLEFLATTATGSVISKLAGRALDALLKMIM